MRLISKKIKKTDGLYCIDDYAMEMTNKGLIPETWLAETYLLKNICEPELNDVVIDGGAFQGETAIWFSQKIGIGGKVYSFEIMESNIDIMKRNIQRNKLQNIIEVVEKGLFNKDDIINVVDKGAGSRYSKETGDNKAHVTSLDKFITLNNIKKVDFIKLDIEGAEIAALKGMKDTIKKFKPKLAICVYHKELDFLDIPIYIKSIFLIKFLQQNLQ